MADIFGISVSALQAFQTAITVTGNNIANASTPGYSKQTAELATKTPQNLGTGYIGAGVDVVNVQRSFNQATLDQYNASQSALGQTSSLKTYTDQIDNLFGTSGDGITAALQSFYSSWSDVANAPTSSASRQALLGQAQTLASALQGASNQLDAADTDINSNINTDITQINSLASSIANLNQQIVANPTPSQAPNDLLDQRDRAISQLSQLVGITTSKQTNGAVDVFVGNGQALVTQSSTTALTAVANSFDPTRVEVGYAGAGTRSISGLISGGDLGGLLAARTQLLDPVRSQIGQIATAVASTVNTQLGEGVDLNGQLGTALFSVAPPTAAASSANTGSGAVTATVSNLGALTGDDYVLTYTGSGYSLKKASDGSNVPVAGAGTAASPLTANGLSLVISGTPASGDQFAIKPTASGGGSLQVLISNGSQLAAAGAVISSAAASNSGSGSIGAATVTNAADPNLFSPTNIQFTSATTYSVNGAGSFTYTPGASIALNGWSVAISGTPAVGDTFTVQHNVGGSGDNRNALALAKLQTQGVLGNGTLSVNGAVSALVTGVGTQAAQTTAAQTAQTAINNHALQNVQSVSGVNLDEEAAALLQWQQAYQASAKALQVGASLFNTVLAAVQAA